MAAAATILNFQKFEILTVVRANILSHAKMRQNRSNGGGDIPI